MKLKALTISSICASATIVYEYLNMDKFGLNRTMFYSGLFTLLVFSFIQRNLKEFFNVFFLPIERTNPPKFIQEASKHIRDLGFTIFLISIGFSVATIVKSSVNNDYTYIDKFYADFYTNHAWSFLLLLTLIISDWCFLIISILIFHFNLLSNLASLIYAPATDKNRGEIEEIFKKIYGVDSGKCNIK